MKITFRTGIATAVFLLLPVPASASQQTPPKDKAVVPLVEPTRRTPDAPPALPPPVSSGADRLEPLTIEAVIRQQPLKGTSHVIHQTIARTADRIHVAMRDGREWLFVRNPKDERRVSGFLVEPSYRVIIVYEESELRNRLGIRGWADVLSLGFDTSLLDGLTPIGTARTVTGIRFTRYAARDNHAATQETWWSAAQVLPLSFKTTSKSGSTSFAIQRLRSGVDRAKLETPAARFPDYRVVDLADWLEHR